MKIVFLARSLGLGGAEGQLVTLVAGLRRRGHEVSVFIFYDENAFAAELAQAGVSICSLAKKGRWDVFPFLRRLLRGLRRERPDILHGYLPVPNILIGMMKPFLKGAKSVFGVRASNLELKKYDWLTRLSYRFEADFAQWSDSIVANSESGRAHAEKLGFPVERMVVIPNGTDTDRFHPDPEARARIRAEIGVGDGTPVIGLVARLDPMKDHPNFLHAALEFCKRVPNVKFVCVGDGFPAYRAYLEKLSARLGLAELVVWMGKRDDVAAIINGFDVATLSSLSEGFPNCLAEAMACGVPCVTTDVGDAARIVGDTGIIVPPRQSVDLAKGWFDMLRRLRDDGPGLREAVRRRVVTDFSRGSLVVRTERHLRALLTG